jgi:hypothetical protein
MVSQCALTVRDVVRLNEAIIAITVTVLKFLELFMSSPLVVGPPKEKAL